MGRGGGLCSALCVARRAAACVRGEPEPEVSRQSPIVPLDTGTVRIETEADTFHVSVEIAETQEQQSIGLMLRDSLPVDDGMLFVYEEPRDTSSGFYMFRTLIPLDIAFLDEEGRIVSIRLMQPCPSTVAAHCPRYRSDVPYSAALEVNRGYLEARGIGLGDRVTLLSRPGG
jgi:uncharacterized protein